MLIKDLEVMRDHSAYNLCEALRMLSRYIDDLLEFGRSTEQIARSLHHRFSFKEISHVGGLVIGVCTWSVKGEHEPDASVVYMAIRQEVRTHIETILSPLILKECWPVSVTKMELWTEERYRPEGFSWWQEFLGTRLPKRQVRLLGSLNLEEAVMVARLRAEELCGITAEQQSRIAELTKEMRLRDEAIRELDLISP